MSLLHKHQQGVGIIKTIILTPFVIIGLAILFFIYTEINKAYWDHRVTELCEKDGGITILEQTELTQMEFESIGGNKYGQIPLVPMRLTKRNYLFYSDESVHYMKKSYPSVYRWEARVYRKKDKVVVGYVINYLRGGGDFPTIISHPSGFDCKNVNIKLDIEKQIFKIKEQ